MGLAYARHVAEALGGFIEVQSPPDISVAGRKWAGTAIRLVVDTQPPRRDSHPSQPIAP